MKQVRRTVVDRRGGDEQDTSPHDEPRQVAVTASLGIAEAVGFVDKKQRRRTEADGGGRGWTAEGFVRDNRRLEVQPAQQGAPLIHQHRGHNEGEPVAKHPGDCERDVRFPQPHGVRQQRAAVPRDDRRQPLCRRALVRREPRRRVRWYLRQVEQGARGSRRDGRRRRRRFRAEQQGQRLGGSLEVLRENPGWRDRAHGDRWRRGGAGRQRGCRR